MSINWGCAAMIQAPAWAPDTVCLIDVGLHYLHYKKLSQITKCTHTGLLCYSCVHYVLTGLLLKVFIHWLMTTAF